MKKILLITQVPPYFELFRKNHQVLPEFQRELFWKRALENLGHQVAVFTCSDPVLGKKKVWAEAISLTQKLLPRIYNKYRLIRNKYYTYFLDNKMRSAQLIQRIQAYKPDVVIFSGGISDLDGREFSILKKSRTAVILLHGVDPQEGATLYELEHTQEYAAIVTNDRVHAKAWLKKGAVMAYDLPYSAVDTNFYRDLEIERNIDVLFVGTLFNDRQVYLEKLIQTGLKLEIYGYLPIHVRLRDSLKYYYKGEAWGKQMVSLFNRAKIAINLVPDHMPTGGNLRTFEIPACGALQLSNRCPKEWYVPAKEIVLFDSQTELLDKINFYLKNRSIREKIAFAGQKRTQQEHTYDQRFNRILKNLER